MPIIDRQDASDVEEHIQRIFAASPSARADELRRLFVEKLDFAPSSGLVNLTGAPNAVELPPQAERLASIDGVNAAFVPLDIANSDRVRKGEATAAAKLISNELVGDLLLVMTNTPNSQLHFIYPTFETSTPFLRRMIVERDLPRRTAVQQLSNIYWNWQDTGSIHIALEQGFDIEAVTKRFFTEYKRIFDLVMNSVEGFGDNDDDQEAKKLFNQTLFNRLMFICFLSRKGWMTFKGDHDYLKALWKDYSAGSGESNFYKDRLIPLFFAGLNNEQSLDLMRNNPGLHAHIGDVPFLNGGLFDETEEDKRTDITIPDDAIEPILTELFERFNFTVMESTPFDVEVAVDPEMLGKVFEELVTGRHETGSYYTPRPVVSFMCREALKGYLEGESTGGADTDAIRAFVDERNTSGLTLSDALKISEALSRLTVVDPACGSGAYLLGMLHELVELLTSLYSAQLGQEPKDLYDLKLQIIERNLYGADIDPFAVNIAMLRLWLSLAIEYEGQIPPPLPNLDFKIVAGNSLTGPNPNPDHYGDLLLNRIRKVADQLERLKNLQLRAIGLEKQRLMDEIAQLQDQLREALADSPSPDSAVDWRVEFAQVFGDSKGFDVVVANPPYVNMVEMDSMDSQYREQLRVQYVTATGGFDLFVPFMERGIQLLKTSGTMAYITPNKLLGAEYARDIRQYISDNAQLLSITDLSSVPVFEASVYPIITISQKISERFDSSEVGIYHAHPDPHNPLGVMFDGRVPMSITEDVGNNWSPLLTEDTLHLLPALRSGKHLADVADVVGAAAVSEAYEWKDAVINDGDSLYVTDPTRYVPFVVSGNIRPFRHTWRERPVRYIKDTYHLPVIDLLHPNVSARRVNQMTSAKVIVSGMAKRPTCVWDTTGIAAGKSTVLVIPNSGVDGAYLCGLLNSKVMERVYSVLFGSLSLAGGYMRFGPPQIRALPVPEATKQERNDLARLAQKRAAADPKEHIGLDEEIDELVSTLFRIG